VLAEASVVPVVLHVVVDGHPCECEDGTSLLDALERRGISVPTLCHDNR